MCANIRVLVDIALEELILCMPRGASSTVVCQAYRFPSLLILSLPFSGRETTTREYVAFGYKVANLCKPILCPDRKLITGNMGWVVPL